MTTGRTPLDRTPLVGFRTHLNTFHYKSGSPDLQTEEHLFCSKLSEEVMQCTVFDGSGETAHLTGIEYIVNRHVFDSFPPEESRLWHSHSYGVKSGEFVAPGAADAVEAALMNQLASSYGKLWRTWNVQGTDSIPSGLPSLMTGFTADGQLLPELLQFRDERLQVSSITKRKQRAAIPEPPPVDASAKKGALMGPVQLQAAPVKAAR